MQTCQKHPKLNGFKIFPKHVVSHVSSPKRYESPENSTLPARFISVRVSNKSEGLAYIPAEMWWGSSSPAPDPFSKVTEFLQILAGTDPIEESNDDIWNIVLSISDPLCRFAQGRWNDVVRENISGLGTTAKRLIEYFGLRYSV